MIHVCMWLFRSFSDRGFDSCSLLPLEGKTRTEKERKKERIEALWSRKINRTQPARASNRAAVNKQRGLRPNELFPHMSSCDYARVARSYFSMQRARLPQLVTSTLCHPMKKKKKKKHGNFSFSPSFSLTTRIYVAARRKRAIHRFGSFFWLHRRTERRIMRECSVCCQCSIIISFHDRENFARANNLSRE